jgi:hypothetical protein
MTKTIYGFYPYFQEGSNALKYVLFALYKLEAFNIVLGK